MCCVPSIACNQLSTRDQCQQDLSPAQNFGIATTDPQNCCVNSGDEFEPIEPVRPSSINIRLKALAEPSNITFQALAEPSKHFVHSHLKDGEQEALAEPSSNQASAEPSKNTHDASARTLPIFRCSNQKTSSILARLSPTAIQKQKQIISTSWPTTTEEAKKLFPEFCEVYEKIKSHNLPNFLGAQITIPSALNLPV